MATNRSRIPRSKAEPEIPEWHSQWLLDGDHKTAWANGGVDAFLTTLDCHRAAWERIGSEATAEYRKKNPGSRPWGWWVFDAPESRRQIGGTGKSILIEDTHFPAVDFGIPRMQRGPLEFETEAEFLKRHGLLTKTEQKSLQNRQKAPKKAENRPNMAET